MPTSARSHLHFFLLPRLLIRRRHPIRSRLEVPTECHNVRSIASDLYLGCALEGASVLLIDYSRGAHAIFSLVPMKHRAVIPDEKREGQTLHH
jgi:hypothetical protein